MRPNEEPTTEPTYPTTTERTTVKPTYPTTTERTTVKPTYPTTTERTTVKPTYPTTTERTTVKPTYPTTGKPISKVYRGDDVLKVHMTTDFKYNAIEGKIRDQGSRLGTFDYLEVEHYYEDHYHYKFQISGVHCPEALQWIEDMVSDIVELRATALRCANRWAVPRKGDVLMYRRYNGVRNWLSFNTNVEYV